jgi:ubiquinone/menaquinone biosynthesis C-methylase UbiE
MFRKVINSFLSVSKRIETRFDKEYMLPDAPMAQTIGHTQWKKFLYKTGNQPGMKILEVGSREVTGKSDARAKFDLASYTGFDFYPGHNVDVVGDAHKLSSYFDPGTQFDMIYSAACFEHFAMPWLVSAEIVKLLKPGGLVFVETHFSYSSHERPWHFFQFSDMAMRILFPPAMGIECVEAGFSNPIVGRFSSLADKYLRNKPVPGLYCHVEFLGKKVREVTDFNWAKADPDQIYGNTLYPSPRTP